MFHIIVHIRIVDVKYVGLRARSRPRLRRRSGASASLPTEVKEVGSSSLLILL
jgi:hypothetical protein